MKSDNPFREAPSWVEFILRDTELTPQQLVEPSGIEPSTTWLMGDPITEVLRRKHNGIMVRIGDLDGSRQPEDLLEELLDSLEPNADRIAAISCCKVLNVVMQPDWATPSVGVSNAMLKRIHHLGAELGIHVYIWRDMVGKEI